jgi:hypothetical protein
VKFVEIHTKLILYRQEQTLGNQLLDGLHSNEMSRCTAVGIATMGWMTEGSEFESQ